MVPPQAPLIRPACEPGASPTLCPNDHLKMLLELLRPAGAELARRWMAALLMAPRDDREGIVEAIEQQMLREYHGDVDEDGPNR
jgi:hypothetical protein